MFCERNFLECQYATYAFHVVKSLTTTIARQIVGVPEKEVLLTAFRRILYSIDEQNYISSETDHIKL